jgi:hypothetical protein
VVWLGGFHCPTDSSAELSVTSLATSFSSFARRSWKLVREAAARLTGDLLPTLVEVKKIDPYGYRPALRESP